MVLGGSFGELDIDTQYRVIGSRTTKGYFPYMWGLDMSELTLGLVATPEGVLPRSQWHRENPGCPA